MKPLLAREGLWTLSVEELGGGAGSFGYSGFIMKRHNNSNQVHAPTVIDGKQKA